jgi:hypothetical protein
MLKVLRGAREVGGLGQLKGEGLCEGLKEAGGASRAFRGLFRGRRGARGGLQEPASGDPGVAARRVFLGMVAWEWGAPNFADATCLSLYEDHRWIIRLAVQCSALDCTESLPEVTAVHSQVEFYLYMRRSSPKALRR